MGWLLLMRDSANPVYCFGQFRYDSQQRLLFRGDEAIPLAPKISDTLYILLENHGRIVEKSELIRHIWPDTSVEEAGLARNISQLRKALGDEGESDSFIETVPKRGYRFAADVQLEKEVRRATEIRARAFGTLRKHRRWLLSIAGLLVVSGAVYWQFYRPSRFLSHDDDVVNIAVIPFECLNTEVDCYAFPHGLNDLLVARISGLDHVHVLSPSTVSSYQRARTSTAFMARVLGLDVVLEGTIQRAGDRVRITPRLVDVHSAKLIWSKEYEFPVDRPSEAQDQASRQISAEVGVHLAIRSPFTSPNR